MRSVRRPTTPERPSRMARARWSDTAFPVGMKSHPGSRSDALRSNPGPNMSEKITLPTEPPFDALMPLGQVLYWGETVRSALVDGQSEPAGSVPGEVSIAASDAGRTEVFPILENEFETSLYEALFRGELRAVDEEGTTVPSGIFGSITSEDPLAARWLLRYVNDRGTFYGDIEPTRRTTGDSSASSGPRARKPPDVPAPPTYRGVMVAKSAVLEVFGQRFAVAIFACARAGKISWDAARCLLKEVRVDPPDERRMAEERAFHDLVALMRTHPDHAPKPKIQFRKEFIEKINGLTSASFDRAWSDAVSATGSGWSSRGRRSRK